jgi:hypothetical protein
MKGGLFYKAGSKSWSRPGRQVEAGVGVVSDIRGFISSWAGTQVAASVFSGVARGGIGGNADHGGERSQVRQPVDSSRLPVVLPY